MTGDDGYEKLLHIVGKKSHKSCIILTGRKEVPVIREFENDKDVYSLILGGLSLHESLKIFQERGVNVSSASNEELQTLFDLYNGHPLALNVASSLIRNSFGGNISIFLQQIGKSDYPKTLDIKSLLNKSFKRLSFLEERIFYLLAINYRYLTVQEIQEKIDDLEERMLVENCLYSLYEQSLIERNTSGFALHYIIQEYAKQKLESRIVQSKNLRKNPESLESKDSIVRSIEFSPELREAGTSILMYFNHILRLKYPDVKVKVRIEQDGFILRMVISTPTGHKESIESTLQEYGMVVVGKLSAELFLNDPLEVMALKNKLEIANLELRQTRDLLNLTQNNSQKRIESLEVQVSKLHRLIEMSFQNKDMTLGVIEKMTSQEGKNYDLRGAKFGGGFATEGGLQTGGTLIDVSSTNSLSEAALQIQELLQQLQTQGSTSEEAQQQVAKDLAKQAESDTSVMGKLVQWGKSIADTASKTTVSEAVKRVIKLGLQMAGITMP